MQIALHTVAPGDSRALDAAIADAFDGASLSVMVSGGRFDVGLQQPGMLRRLGAAELSDGTLRYLLLVAALLTPRPPQLMVLNEPETSLHPDLLPPLARQEPCPANSPPERGRESPTWTLLGASEKLN